MNKELNKLIEYALADGNITDKERAVFISKALESGLNLDEFEIYLDAKIVEAQKKGIGKRKALRSDAKTSLGAFNKELTLIDEEIANPSLFNKVRSVMDTVTDPLSIIFSSRRYERDNERKYALRTKQAEIIKTFPLPKDTQELLELAIMSTNNYKEGRYNKMFESAWKSRAEQAISMLKVLEPNNAQMMREVEKLENKMGRSKTEEGKKKKSIFGFEF